VSLRSSARISARQATGNNRDESSDNDSELYDGDGGSEANASDFENDDGASEAGSESALNDAQHSDSSSDSDDDMEQPPQAAEVVAEEGGPTRSECLFLWVYGWYFYRRL
jgi:hypothetical protein